MPTILQKLRSGIAKADEYIQEHDLAAKLDPIATVGGFLVVLSLVVLGIYGVVVVPHVVIQRSLDAALAADRAKQLELEDTYRKTITQIVLGVFGLFLLYFTWRRSVASDKTVRIAEQGHITDRFTKAIEQLGKTDNGVPNIEVRLGAIYALERIAFDSPRDHWTIMEILTAYVRQNAPLDSDRPYTKGEQPRTDIQAILTVIGRRKIGPNRERPEHRLDLTKSHLCGANLQNVQLKGAYLEGASLQWANLREANLQGASLRKADLLSADLNKTNLHNADLDQSALPYARLNGANLQGSSLIGANLQMADLTEANLQLAVLHKTDIRKAFFWKTNLQEAGGLTLDQVRSAFNWRDAHYSPAFRAELGLPPEPDEEKE